MLLPDSNVGRAKMTNDNPFLRLRLDPRSTASHPSAPVPVKGRPPKQTTSAQPHEASTYEHHGQIRTREDHAQHDPLRGLDPPVERRASTLRRPQAVDLLAQSNSGPLSRPVSQQSADAFMRVLSDVIDAHGPQAGSDQSMHPREYVEGTTRKVLERAQKSGRTLGAALQEVLRLSAPPPSDSQARFERAAWLKQCLQEAVGRQPPEATRVTSHQAVPPAELHDRLLNNPQTIRFDRETMLAFRASNCMFYGDIELQSEATVHADYNKALRGHLECMVGNEGAVVQNETQFVLRGMQSYLDRQPNADAKVHSVADALKRLVACGVAELGDKEASSPVGVRTSGLLQDSSVPRVLVHVDLADSDGPGQGHAVIVELVKRRGPPDKLDAIVFNTGLGCCEENGHHPVGSAVDNKWTTSVTFRDIPANAMTPELVQKICHEAFPAKGPQSLYGVLGNLPGAWRDDRAPAVIQAQQKNGDCTLKAHLALIKYHTGDVLFPSLRAEIYTTSLEDVRHALGDQVENFDRAAAKTAYMQAKAMNELSPAGTERHRRGFRSLEQQDKQLLSRSTRSLEEASGELHVRYGELIHEELVPRLWQLSDRLKGTPDPAAKRALWASFLRESTWRDQLALARNNYNGAYQAAVDGLSPTLRDNLDGESRLEFMLNTRKALNRLDDLLNLKDLNDLDRKVRNVASFLTSPVQVPDQL